MKSPNSRQLWQVSLFVLAAVSAFFLGGGYLHHRSPLIGTLVKEGTYSEELNRDAYKLYLRNNSNEKLSVHCIRQSCGRMLRITKLNIAAGDEKAVSIYLPYKQHMFVSEDLRFWVESDTVEDRQVQIYR